MKQKIYCYIDESGQDTKGAFFIVSLVIAKEVREKIYAFLERVEKDSRKGKVKWSQALKIYKIAYIEQLFSSSLLKGKLFYTLSKDTKAYKELTLIAIASVINIVKEKEYKAAIFIDGLAKSDIPRVGAGLRKIGIHIEKVRGIRDESNAIIRFADAIAGLVRENYQEIEYAKKLYTKGIKSGILREA